MESMPAILLFCMINFQNCDIKEVKQVENYEYKIFLDEGDEDFTWENVDMCGCVEEVE